MEKEIYFAGGCFWGVEHFFKGVHGVTDVRCGYANGIPDNPSYEEVYTDKTGHAETVRVRYNDERISLQELTRLFFATIDPSLLNRQGHDEGTRYRTGVFYTSEDDAAVLRQEFARQEELLHQEMPEAAMQTELLPLSKFFPAEEYHHDYLDKNPGGYCHLDFKVFVYLQLYQDLKALLEGETDSVARMSEAAALIAERMKFFWTGFYRVIGRELVLGPFQGPAACLRIGFGRGVCGTSWKQARTIVVPDVEEFPGHIACSSLSRSEIVVPLFDADGKVTAVLDIDSTSVGTFDRTDASFLRLIADLV
ncbi:MAG: peptide-methionine (S)-S-oxide reductase MsrA [Bacteroidales bacterium]|nr:peptide-methionine (S)-S-oxide reductase MsrA [Bacteroidales bacterium]